MLARVLNGGQTLCVYHPAGFKQRDKPLCGIQELQTLKSHAGDNILMLDGIHLALCISFSSRDGMKDWKLMKEFQESWLLNPALSLQVRLTEVSVPKMPQGSL